MIGLRRNKKRLAKRASGPIQSPTIRELMLQTQQYLEFNQATSQTLAKQIIEQGLADIKVYLADLVKRELATQIAAIGSNLTDSCSQTATRAILRPVIERLISLVDRMQADRKFQALRFQRNPELGNHLGCRQLHQANDEMVASFYQELLMILQTLDVTPLQSPAGRFDPKDQQVVKVEPTTNAELNGHVKEIVRAGYVWCGTVLRPEQIIVYKKKEMKNG